MACKSQPAEQQAAENDSPPSRVFIVGASPRGAAHSAVRAGIRPVCAALFADADLQSVADVLAVSNYPRGLIAASLAATPSPWMYTGALENHPSLVARLSQSRVLWGNGAGVLVRIRNPWNLRRELEQAGLPSLAVWPDDGTVPPGDGRWMRKPCKGSAGRAIDVWRPDATGAMALREPHYFQERRTGLPVSALFLAAPAKIILLGITRQLIGLSEANAPPHAYCGSIAPCRLPRSMRVLIGRIGERVGTAFGLQGLYGCDFIADSAGPWLTEVNPRYTASVELIEQSLGFPLLGWHRRACEGFQSGLSLSADLDALAAQIAECHSRPRHVAGKIVLYANRPFAAGNWTRFVTAPKEFRLPFLADIPPIGQPIFPGEPICTLFATATETEACLGKLLRRARRFYRRL